jgi:hypothetical protein
MSSSEQIVQTFTALRYVAGEIAPVDIHLRFSSQSTGTAAVPFIVVLYDHIITIGREVNTIWNNPTVNWKSKAAFFANRYPTEVILAIVVYS